MYQLAPTTPEARKPELNLTMIGVMLVGGVLLLCPLLALLVLGIRRMKARSDAALRERADELARQQHRIATLESSNTHWKSQLSTLLDKPEQNGNPENPEPAPETGQ